MCELLRSIRPGTTWGRDTAGYQDAKDEYWSNTQRELDPLCIYQPKDSGDVSLAIVLARYTQCPFAMKSGGHGKFSGESSIHDGVTIDLQKINHAQISSDRETVKVGPGNRWFDVYTKIEPEDLMVVGGRDSHVGVGGFLLGGGISFHSSQRGFGSDNIRSFEVVIANGSIVTASETAHPDLYKALRGGGANFGVVTSFELETVPYNGIWGGMVSNAWEHTDAVLAAFLKCGRTSTSNPKASVILNCAPIEGTWIWNNDIQYCDPFSDSKILEPFMSIPAVRDETSSDDLSTQTMGLARFTRSGIRNSYFAAAFVFDERILRFFIDTWTSTFDPMIPQMPGCRPTFNVQVITSGMRRGMRRHGGNVLGLSDSDEPLLLFNPTPKWTEADQDQRIYDAIMDILEKTKALPVELDMDNDFLYMNYASHLQDPVATYGPEMNDFLQTVADTYDPEGVFQYLQPGSFKLRAKE